MQIRHHDALIEIQTPAKVNLFLEVLRRREDGFHEIETLMVPVDLVDTLRCSVQPDGRLDVACRWTRGCQATAHSSRDQASPVWDDLPEGDGNLVYRALERLRNAAGTPLGLNVEILKRIPVSAGLGGASSDAAAALTAANRLWRLDWPRERLSEVAAAVGSDVPFFLENAAAVCRGRGEVLERVDGFAGWWLVIVRPPAGLSTADVYRNCSPACAAKSPASGEASAGLGHAGNDRSSVGPRSVVKICDAAARGDVAAAARQLFNRLQPAAEQQSPWIGRLRAAFERADCLGHQMSGSGSSYFGICRHAGHARRLAGRLRSAGLGAVFVTATRASKEERHEDHRGSHQTHGEFR
ncbi:MAG: 4-(cytidine 5'-diphospho)-2-C-methyl-D-erythritol kinase [Pirellulaceae bacterium]|nr:4-(cytidine 5'-diphospho)-2-C-methyl-D-erythritol kinase [Pirellulaceae bacterium]